ncbi:hypothetical protein [Nocardiopsis ganjiahuensis]|uniref:hypothetical protein n=1 Tax=Nocardiopsis ganjiahuensis TaxID=239984 RepID=UPI000344D0C7|nr:hypothetical protein [Nocardiopsis ganjiahuensis]
MVSPHLPPVELSGDAQGRKNAKFIAAARQDVPALLDEIAALEQATADALTLAEQAAADRRSLRTEVDRLRRLLDTRDADYALVARVSYDGRGQVDGRAGVGAGQVATWLRELAAAAAVRAHGIQPVRSALCAARCPNGHEHTCARSPKHCGPHRDVKQKGHESCSWPAAS